MAKRKKKSEQSDQQASLAETRSKRKRTPAKSHDYESDGEPPKKFKRVVIKFGKKNESEVETIIVKPVEPVEEAEDDSSDLLMTETPEIPELDSDRNVLMSDLLEIIKKLFAADIYLIFHVPVSEADVPGYYKIIKHPMDLSTLKSHLCQFKYKTVGSFIHDLNLIFSNAMGFNPHDTIYYKEAERLQHVANEALKDISESAKIVEPDELRDLEPEFTLGVLKKGFNRVIDEFISLDTMSIFYEPVHPSVPNYYLSIDRPLDFTTLKKKVNTNKLKTIADLKNNLKLIFANAMKFNDSSTVFHKQAKALSKKIDEIAGTIKPAEQKTPKTPKTTKSSKVAKTKSPKAVPEPKEEEESEPEPIPVATPKTETPKQTKKDRESSKPTSATKKSSSRKDRPTPAAELEFPKVDTSIMNDLQLAFLNKMRQADYFQIFHNPVEGIDGYTDVIEKPMDFSTMEKNVTSNEYNQEWRAFEADIDLIFANCKRFNLPGSVYAREGNRLLRLFRKWKKDMYNHYSSLPEIDNSKVLETFDQMAVVKAKKVDQSLLDEAPEEEPVPETPAPSAFKGGARPMSEIISELNDELIQQDKHNLFLHPLNVKGNPPHYTPMDFTRMKGKRYKKLGLFEEDFKLLCDNAMHYNKSDTLIFKEAKRLLRYGEEKIKEIRSRVISKKDDEKPHSERSERAAKKATRKERASSRKKPTVNLKEAVELYKKQMTELKELVKTNTTLHRLQKRDKILTEKDYCPLVELGYIPDAVKRPVLSGPGEFPAYSYGGSRARSVDVLGSPLMMSPMQYPSTPTTPAPILQQLFQSQTDSPYRATPVTPSSPFMSQTHPLLSGRQVQPFAYAQPQVRSYKPMRVVPKTQMAVKRYVEKVQPITDIEYESLSNMTLDACLRSTNAFPSLVFKNLTKKKDKETEKRKEEFSASVLLEKRRKVDDTSDLLSLLTGHKPTIQSKPEVEQKSKEDNLMDEVLNILKGENNEVGDVEMAEKSSSDIDEALLRDLQHFDDVSDDKMSEEALQQITRVMHEEGVTDFSIESL